MRWVNFSIENNLMGGFMVTTQEKRKTVEESAKTRKARAKLKKRLDALERKITPQALEKKVIEIHRWIALNAMHRVVLRTKDISLFDENQNTASVSRKIAGIADQIQKDVEVSYKNGVEQRGEEVLKKLRNSLKESNCKQ